MRLIEQSAEYLPQGEGIQGVYKQIERAGRICYKSEDKMTDSSSEAFVKRLVDNGHTAMLEHGTVYLKTDLPEDEITPCESLYHYKHNPYSKYYVLDRKAYITTNYRVIQENNWFDDMQHRCEPTMFHSEVFHSKRHTMKLVTSIGIVRELLRHRKFSFANESTRFCSYGKNRFGNELTFVQPYWLNENTPPAVRLHYLTILSNIEEFYVGATNGKLKTTVLKSSNNEEERMHEFTPLQAQQVRGILPLDIKSEIVMTGFEDDWKHFFDLRLYGKTGKPHPDMVILAQKIKDEFERNGIKL